LKPRSKFILKNLFFFNSKLNGRKLGFNTPLRTTAGKFKFKTKKSTGGIHSFPAWRSAFKRVSVEIGRQVRLLRPWARNLTELPLPMSG